MSRLFYLLIFSTILFSCKKGFVINNKAIILTNTIVNTDEILEHKLEVEAYYKGDRIEPEIVIWFVKDANQVAQTIQESNTKNMKWKPSKPGKYTISATATFNTKDDDKISLESETIVYPSFNFLKSKVIGNFDNADELNPGFKLNLTINSDYSYSAYPEFSNFSQNVFYKAKNTYTNCTLNLQSADNNGRLQGFITVTDSATNTLRTDIIRDLTFTGNYYTMSFKQLYANDTTQFRFFELNRK